MASRWNGRFYAFSVESTREGIDFLLEEMDFGAKFFAFLNQFFFVFGEFDVVTLVGCYDITFYLVIKTHFFLQ